MKLLITAAILLILTSLGVTQVFVDPNTGAERTFTVPLGTKYGLVPYTDTLHVTTAEKGWELGEGCVGFTLINPNDYFMLWRLSNVAGIIQSYLGNYGTLDLYPPGSLKKDNSIDSLFVDGEGACTLYLIYWVAE